MNKGKSFQGTSQPAVHPYGGWPSPLSATNLTAAATIFSLLKSDGSTVYWSERRPHENARVAIVCKTVDGEKRDVIDARFSARSKVHEYGGGHYTVHDGLICFVNETDQDIYLTKCGEPIRLTECEATRFADMEFDGRGELIYAVCEHHRSDSPPQNTLSVISTSEKNQKSVLPVLVGRDFYSSPRLSVDGERIAWLAWDLPSMPWESAELWVGTIGDDGGIFDAILIAGEIGKAAFQPEWSPEGALYFVAAYKGWANLHVWRDGKVSVVAPVEADFSRPQWAFAMTSYSVLEEGLLFASCWKGGVCKLGIADESLASWTLFDSTFTRIEDVSSGGDHIALCAGDDLSAPSIHFFDRGEIKFSPNTDRQLEILCLEDISCPRVLHINQAGVRALFYPPASSQVVAPADTLPPLVVSAHGGPTGMARRGLALDRQYWTTRGFAFLDVDYRGSSGYGEAFRTALDGLWGRADSDDAIEAAKFVANVGYCDAGRMVIRGSSAGGLTVLNALISSDIFAAGASYYGVTDLVRLSTDTHKFESGYLTGLMGGMPEDVPEIYAARSPVNNADAITAPVIFFQGLDDRVVPPEQSRVMAASLMKRNIPVAMLEFKGEGHGFRLPETQIKALEAEYAFYARVLGLEPAQPLPHIDISNLKGDM